MSDFARLADESLMIVFAYAPAGLGHLRVTDALYDGMPKGTTTPILLGSQDEAIRAQHRLVSVHPVFQFIFEWTQQGPQQFFITALYRFFLRVHTKTVRQQMITLLDQRLTPPRTVLIVATHFGMAHQLGKLKAKLQSELNIRIILIVQVTDDSPQHIWYVPEADLTFVPSERTKRRLLSYGKLMLFKPIEIVVNSYPLSPNLEIEKDNIIEERLEQLNPNKEIPIHVTFPISGAGVGLPYLINLSDFLAWKSPRFVFHVISRLTYYTETLIGRISKRPYMQLLVSGTDHEVVKIFEKVNQKQTIALEVTKPSEQAFKALLNPTQVGGAILLFMKPVGLQERDNLDFLRRHDLIPSVAQTKKLWDSARSHKKLTDAEGRELYEKAHVWRGIELPLNPSDAADFVWWCMKSEIFLQMVNCCVVPGTTDSHPEELSPRGVASFWMKIEEYMEQR